MDIDLVFMSIGNKKKLQDAINQFKQKKVGKITLTIAIDPLELNPKKLKEVMEARLRKEEVAIKSSSFAGSSDMGQIKFFLDVGELVVDWFLNPDEKVGSRFLD